MKLPIGIIILLLFTTCFISDANNEDSIFIVERIPFRQFDKSILSKPKYKNCFYEDSIFKAYSYCKGEFGGLIKFVHQRNGMDRYVESTCPISINRIDGNYFITSSLTHLRGSTSIQKISNLDSKESHLTITSILDTTEILTLGSFVYKNELFHLMTNRQKTFIAKIEKGNIKVVQTLVDRSLFMYSPKMIATEDETNVLVVRNLTEKSYLTRGRISGYITIKDDKITLSFK